MTGTKCFLLCSANADNANHPLARSYINLFYIARDYAFFYSPNFLTLKMTHTRVRYFIVYMIAPPPRRRGKVSRKEAILFPHCYFTVLNQLHFVGQKTKSVPFPLIPIDDRNSRCRMSRVHTELPVARCRSSLSFCVTREDGRRGMYTRTFGFAFPDSQGGEKTKLRAERSLSKRSNAPRRAAPRRERTHVRSTKEQSSSERETSQPQHSSLCKLCQFAYYVAA